MALTNDEIEAALGKYIEPNMGSDLVSAGCVKNLDIENHKITIEIELGFPINGYEKALESDVRAALAVLGSDHELNLSISSKITAHAVQTGAKRLPKIKNTIAIASGKGASESPQPRLI